MPCVSNAFKDYTSINHPIKNKHNNFFIMLELNSSMFVQTFATACTAKVRTGWPYYVILEFFFNGLAKTAHACFDRPEY